ncbi:tRNA 2-thiouridine(34) synthase MnmA [Halorhodospira abdelmalekii]|uniref:tRNA 2-thiouridine(34) synthase MnmA n=1 Tax=Halorhodospira abdelmalekii TaxID=421629 RepID=UPI0019037124|nr:tRNA 2-thiouridine(34) synthase MnmA [Halorhodospira abdelmalekii]MBK1733944.1 tRNA 2-thiouridine(34) synthase MnmA [Halorhodospira abdelmalekii]
MTDRYPQQPKRTDAAPTPAAPTASDGPRVVVGLSGGVDSAVAALWLLRAGYRVEGLFMKNWEDDDTLLHCAAAEDFAAAAAVAEQLGIKLHRVNFAAAYRERVFAAALDELRAGRTPNPDILCNRYIKFDLFLRHAREQLGAEWVATGHYARLRRDPDTPDGEPPQLLRGLDPEKDQSYFLAAIEPEALRHVLFPLGEHTKETIRDTARAAGLSNAERPDSTGICFIGERDFATFMQRYIAPTPGPILTPEGESIGEHQGLAFYTLGQRRGLRIGGRSGQAAGPWYVAAKDASRNALIVVPGDDHPWLFSRAVISAPVHWLAPPPPEGSLLEAQVRYRQRPQRGRLFYHPDGGVTFHFEQPQRAATPGQQLVLYAGARCLGSAPIQQTQPSEAAATEQPLPGANSSSLSSISEHSEAV